VPLDFQYIQCARFWNMKPWELRSLDPLQIAELLAAYCVDGEIEGYYNSEQARRMDRATKSTERNQAGKGHG
jgi:hypothetical protein